MKPLTYFIVEIPKRINDTIKTNGGLELYIDTKFKEFDYRVNEGKVVGAPHKYNTGAEVGDTLYFHHHVVINDGQPLTGKKDTYVVIYSDDSSQSMASQAFAYKNKDGDVKLLSGWVLLEPAEKEEKKTSGIIEEVKLKDDPELKGVVAFDDAPWVKELGVKKGDVVGFKKNLDYRLKIDGKEYYRMPASELLYVEEKT